MKSIVNIWEYCTWFNSFEIQFVYHTSNIMCIYNIFHNLNVHWVLNETPFSSHEVLVFNKLLQYVMKRYIYQFINTSIINHFIKSKTVIQTSSLILWNIILVRQLSCCGIISANFLQMNTCKAFAESVWFKETFTWKKWVLVN